jgi:K+ transporter
VSRVLLVPVSMIAISLFLADSLVTPGMSVLSAIEGESAGVVCLSAFVSLFSVCLLCLSVCLAIFCLSVSLFVCLAGWLFFLLS